MCKVNEKITLFSFWLYCIQFYIFIILNMISAKLLNGNIISRDADFSKYIETVSEPWVIKWFVVSATKVGIGKARVPVSRSNGESLYVLVISDSETSISGNGDVYINIPQEIIDNWEIANEDWTGIATIEVGTMPSKNALKLATISNGAVTDERNILKKVSDLEPLISALDERTTTLEEEVGEILDKWAIDHLEESWIVWEKYTLSDTLFMQQSPLSSNCTLEANVWDVDANKQIHIQRMWSWTESNQIQLKLKKVWAPTQNLIVEVRRGVKVDVSSNEAYWYWDEVITSSEIAYGNITTDFAEYTVTFPESFWTTQGELLNIVVRQNSDIVNSTNYYVIACDSTQYSEAYSYVSVNGTTRARSKLMPYCSSSGFAQSLLCKVNNTAITRTQNIWTFPKTTTDKITIIKHTASNIIRVFPWNIPYTFTSGSSSYYDYLKWNYWINDVIDSWWSAYQKNRDLMTYRDDLVETTKSFWAIELKQWDVLKIWFTKTWWTWTVWPLSPYFETYLQKKPFNWIRLQPRLMKDLWQIAIWTSLWEWVDWKFYGWFMIEKSETATTWSITPWNFQWYITTNFNWEIIKIPYYL